MSKVVEVNIHMRFRVQSEEEAQQVYHAVGEGANALRSAHQPETFRVMGRPRPRLDHVEPRRGLRSGPALP